MTSLPDSYERPRSDTPASIDAIHTAQYDQLVEEILAGNLSGGEKDENPLQTIINTKEKVSDWEQLDRSVELHQRIFERADMPAPTIDDIKEGGVDIKQMKAVFDAMEKDGLQPQIIMLPYKSDTGMTVSIERWDAIYSTYEHSRSQGTGVFTMGSPWLIKPPDAVGGVNYISIEETKLQKTDVKLQDGASGDNWLICLMSNTSEFDIKESTETIMNQLGISDERFYILPTVSHYLAYQALRIEQGLPPIDDAMDNEYVSQISTFTPSYTVLQAEYFAGAIKFSLVDPIRDNTTRGHHQIIYF